MSKLVKHFVKEPKLYLRIEELNLADAESTQLTELVTLLYHQKLLNKVLDVLEEEDRKIFLQLVLLDTDDNYLEFLHQKIGNIEEVVQDAIGEIEKQIAGDLESVLAET